MAGAAVDADTSRAPGLTSGLQGSVNVHRGAIVGATMTVHQFFCILHVCTILVVHVMTRGLKGYQCRVVKSDYIRV